MAPIILTVIGVLLVSPTVSWAYVDPNTVGFASQFLAPLGTLLVSCLIYFRRRLSAGVSAGWQWLRRRPPASHPDGTDA